MIGPGAGLGSKALIKVIGPSNRGQLDADKTNFTNKGGQVIYTDSADLDSITATPGIRQMTNITWRAFAQTINDMTLDNGYPDFRSLVEGKEIGGTEPGDIHTRRLSRHIGSCNCRRLHLYTNMKKEKCDRGMRQAIRNKIYDTETSTLLAYGHNLALDMNAHCEKELYQSPKGQYSKYSAARS